MILAYKNGLIFSMEYQGTDTEETVFSNFLSLELSSKKPSNPCAEQRFGEVADYLQYLPPGDGPGPELASLILNPHFSKLLIAHDLISSQIYQQPNLR